METPLTAILWLYDLAWPSTWVLACVCVFLCAFYHYHTSYRGRWEKYGIPVPPAWPVINHWPAFRNGEEAPLGEWFKQYGDTYGTYGMFPREPVLVTRDLRLIKQILVKDYWNFMNRYQVPLISTWNSLGNGLFFSRDTAWRRYRHVMTPMFTGGRLRLMLTHIKHSANNLRDLIGLYSSANELVPVKHVCGKFSAEIMARVGFGIDTHAVTKGQSEFGLSADKYFRTCTPAQKWTHTFSQLFPPLFNIVRRLGLKVDAFDEDSDAYFVRLLKQEMIRRRQERSRNVQQTATRDMLDIFLDAEVPHGDPQLQHGEAKAITEDEIVANINNLIVAAFETVSSVLQATIYYLALYPDVQQRVLEEVDHVMGASDDVTYEQLHCFVYMDQVLQESMRLQPVNSSIFRESIQERTIEGVTIPAGSTIVISLANIFNDPRHWGDNPSHFDPDRFSPENCKARDPMAFLPFGLGPKHCVGMRFAYMELKVVLVTLLTNFRFEMSERSEPPKGQTVKIVRAEFTFQRPDKPIMVEAVTRNKKT